MHQHYRTALLKTKTDHPEFCGNGLAIANTISWTLAVLLAGNMSHLHPQRTLIPTAWELTLIHMETWAHHSNKKKAKLRLIEKRQPYGDLCNGPRRIESIEPGSPRVLEDENGSGRSIWNTLFLEVCSDQHVNRTLFDVPT